MTSIPQLPGAHAWKDGQGRPLPVEFYRFFRDLALRQDIPADVSAQVASLLVRVEALEAESDAQIRPDSPITVAGTLAGGMVVVGLENKTAVVGGTLLKTTFDTKGLRIEEEAATASDLPYDNAASGFAADDVQAAIDEVSAAVAEVDGAVPFYVPGGETYTVKANKQALFTMPIELGDGASLVLDGALAEVD